MKFGPVSLDGAEGAILAHTVRAGGTTVKKGTRLTADHLETFRAGGLSDVIVARLEPGDVHEDEAAARIARALRAGGLRLDPPFTGRCNVFAEAGGVFVVDRAAIDAANAVDPGITVATLDEYARVGAARMVATVKIIPFAVPAAAVDAVVAQLEGRGAIAVHPFVRTRIGLIATRLPALKEKVLDKTRAVFDGRLDGSGASVIEEIRIDHDEAAIVAALKELAPRCDVLVIFGASAIVDIADAVPAGVVATGGRIEQFGMPVDPGNLLFVGDLAGTPVIGAPGCARSPRENGFDWVLERILADIPVTANDIRGMGVGGLLMEIESRPQPRRGKAEGAESGPATGAIVLAAGRSQRMGAANKLLSPVGGKAMVLHPVEAARQAGLSPIVVVTGHQADEVRAVLAGQPVEFAHNPDFADGLSTSLKAGLAALPEDTEAAFILLGDMPLVSATLLRQMRQTLSPAEGHWIVVPRMPDGQWGNPVLLHRRFFSLAATATGDKGARSVLSEHADAAAFVTADAREIGLDIDTPETLAALEA